MSVIDKEILEVTPGIISTLTNDDDVGEISCYQTVGSNSSSSGTAALEGPPQQNSTNILCCIPVEYADDDARSGFETKYLGCYPESRTDRESKQQNNNDDEDNIIGDRIPLERQVLDCAGQCNNNISIDDQMEEDVVDRSTSQSSNKEGDFLFCCIGGDAGVVNDTIVSRTEFSGASGSSVQLNEI
jgi:hypothetical protein